MKKNSNMFFVSILAMLSSFASCDKNENFPSEQSAENNRLVISLPGVAVTKAIEDKLPGTSTTIEYNNVTTILYYDYDGIERVKLYAWGTGDLTEKKKSITEVDKPTKVRCIVNLPTPQLTTLKALVTENAPYTTEIKINEILNSILIETQNLKAGPEPVISSKKLTYTGETLITNKFTDGVLNVTVDVQSIVSRFEIGNLYIGDGLESLNVEAVYVNKFKAINNSANGIVNISSDLWPNQSAIANGTATCPENLPTWAETIRESGTLILPEEKGKVFSFHVFPGKEILQIIYRVSGKTIPTAQLGDGTTGAFTNKYITISKYKLNDPADGEIIDQLAAHKIYSVGTKNKIMINAIDIDDKPNKVKGTLNVDISINDWSSDTLFPEAD